MEFFQSLDQSLFHLTNTSLSNAYFDFFFPAITDLHKTVGFRYVFVPILFALLLYFQRGRGLSIVMGLSVSLSLADKIGSFMKHFWLRPRPFEAAINAIQRSPAGGYSFPSNHAVNMFCMAFFLSAFFPKGRWLFFTVACLVSFSRIYNGVHYPFDVLFGAFIGSSFGIVGAQFTKRLYQKIAISLEARKRKHHG